MSIRELMKLGQPPGAPASGKRRLRALTAEAIVWQICQISAPSYRIKQLLAVRIIFV